MNESTGNPASGAKPIRRRAPTRRSVLIADKAADWTIRIGGIGVILAVFGIMAFLAEVVVPLFTGGEVLSRIERTKAAISGRVLVDKMDEYRTLSIALTDDGKVTAFHIPSGRAVEARDLDLGGRPITAFAHLPVNGLVALGFADGSVRFGKLGIEARIMTEADLPGGLQDLGNGDRSDGRAVYSVLPGGQIRRLAVAANLDPPQSVAEGKAIVALDYRASGTVERPSRAFVSVDADGVIRLSNVETRVNLLTRQSQTRVSTATLPALPAGVKVNRVLMTEKADQVYVAGANGLLYRYDTRNFNQPKLAEQLDPTSGGQTLTLLDFLNGEQSIVVGTSTGAVDIYFRLQQQGARTSDGYALVRAHRLEPHAGAVAGFAPSIRTKSFVTSDDQGNIWFRHATSEQTLLKIAPPAAGVKYEALVLAPRDDGILAIGDDGRYYMWSISVPHPETTLLSIFGKVWYEGYGEPTYTWQSSSGTDTFEPKFSLVPLIFGTIKATLYCMLFAVPIALAAAIFTSEFVRREVRAVVKPTMEMMASLPSVVLGFIAALILAPVVENWIAAMVLAFVTIPLGLFLGAYLWQMLPERMAIRFGGLPKLALMFAAVLAACYGAYLLGPAFEDLFFAGDLKAWANGSRGSDAPFLALLLLPVSFLLTAFAFNRSLGGALRERLRALPPAQAGMVDFLRWAALLILSVGASFLLAWVMVAIGLAPRGAIVDTYVQRNTLVVGFAMGFAVIPIIYTIAEDALNSVPEHLRAASLACGATPWQTAISIILPTAMSGVFAAIMIGMGRAVGETMIVVMAAGNTPVMEWNIFSGLRALSANIAVELPEAVKDDTLYRMLFLAALTLFVMTFVINTLAELIRQRFRKRAMQL